MSTHRLRRAPAGLATLLTLVGLLAVFLSPPAPASSPPEGKALTKPAAAEPFSALVFSKTAGFRHDSIEVGIAAIEQLGVDNGFTVDATEDAGAFTEENLANYDVIVWLSTTGDVLNDQQQAAFEAYIKGGGGYAGIHAASDTEYDWPWYGELVGAYFDSHPPGTPAGTVDVHDHQHPSTAGLPQKWQRTDEWYNYQENPRGDVHVLATLDESSYEGGNMGEDHPIAWCQDVSGGRSWYTGGGHTKESFADPQFVNHLLGGIQTAAGAVDADCGATVADSFEQVTLAKGADKTGEPIAMAVLPSGDVLHTSRNGTVWYTTADATTAQAGKLDVYSHDEDGLQGVAVDPNFAENRWVYLYYAPTLDTPAGDAPETGTPADFEPFQGHNQLSRFKLGEDNVLDLASEQKILQIPANRGLCCHAGGEIDFDADGNLLLSTGDDTNPFASDGYTPIDERENRNPAFDAQRSSGNTNDLRGKLLRIKVQDDGSYTIPPGNLFAEGTDKTRPEIYAMGFRNPFRFSVDKETGWIYLGDYGPDAGSANADRGPAGTVEFNLIKEAGNYGWPYCVGDNQAFNDYDFATGQSGPKFDCSGPKNESPHNTGLVDLPEVQPAWIPYDGNSVPEFGSGGESPMGGVVYDYDPDLESDTKWPQYYDGLPLLYEWDRAWIKEAHTDVDGALQSIVPTLDWMDLRRPMNLEFGPNGSLYVLDYGGGYFGGDELSAVYRIDYVKGNRPPEAVIDASPRNGPTPLDVSFDASGSSHPEDLPLAYEWDFDGDGTTDSTDVQATHTYEEAGQYSPQLVVTDSEGRKGFASAVVTAGNTEPTVKLDVPVNGGFFDFGDQVPFEVTVTDPEDGAQIDCERVVVEYILGHDNHGHPLSSERGCSGTITTVADDGHGLDADVFGVINATYTDGGGDGAPALTGEDEAKLHTRTKQAEFFDEAEGVQALSKDVAEGGKQVGNIEPGDWFAFDTVNLINIEAVSARYMSGGTGGTLELRSGAVDGPLVATLDLTPTGGWEAPKQSEPVPVEDPGGTKTLYAVATGPNPASAVFDVDSLTFDGKGVSSNTAPKIKSVDATPQRGAAPLEVAFGVDATDPDGDEVSYAWDFGDGTQGEGASPIHTYEEAGEYNAKVTASDPSGAKAHKTVQISVTATVPCEQEDPQRGPDDEFDGDAIDGCRWDVRDYRPDLGEVRDGAWVVTTTDADFYQTPNETVPNIITTDQPGDNWTVETKFNAAFETSWQQAGLTVYDGPSNYVKFDPVVDGSGDLRFELRSEVDDAIVGPTVDATEPKSTYGDYLLRLTRSGDTYSGAYSIDNGETWKEMPGTVENTVVADAGVGVFALGKGAGANQIDVAFDYVRQVDGPEPCTPVEPEDGYRMLFDGTEKSLNDWNMAGPGSFELQNDCSIRSKGGMGLLWHPDELGSYSLKADWKMAGDDNSGVFVGFPDPADDPWIAVNEGFEIQIDATDEPDRTTGAIYTFQGADQEARDEALNPPGEWNSYEIIVEGQTITVFLNDMLINEFENPADSGRDLVQGFVGLQNHGDSDDVSFRNVQVKDLDRAKASVDATVRPSTITYGKEALVRATVTGDGDAAPTGEVVVRAGEKVLGKAQLDSHGKASIRVSDLDAGRHDLQVSYAGDDAYSVADTTVRLRVTKARSRTSATVKPNPVRTSKHATVRARVRSRAGTPTGKVRVLVKRGKQVVQKRIVSLNAQGLVSVKLRKLKRAGKYRVVTTYRGSANLATSRAIKPLRVRR